MRLFERSREANTLAKAFDACSAGIGQFVIITGGPGSGKSELVHDTLKTVGEVGATVLLATASPTRTKQPLSIFRQLLRDAEVSCATLEQLASTHPGWYQEDGGGTGAFEERDWPNVDSERAVARTAEEATAALIELSSERPLVIAVDDAHLMDDDSLAAMLSLLHRIRKKRILVLCVSWEQSGVRGPVVHRQLIRQPHERVRIAPLTEDGVAALLSRHAGRPVERETSDAYHRATGGNPMLVHALLDDSARFGSEPGEPVASSAYRQAVLTCLGGTSPAHTRIGAAIAVLGDFASARNVALVSGDSLTTVLETVSVLNSSGLLSDYAFRHPAAAEAVLNDLSETELARINTAAAQLLYQAGAPERDVAARLLAADEVVQPWGPKVLRGAADLALGADNVRESMSYLRLALRDRTDEHDRHRLLAALGRAAWRVNPAAAEASLAQLRRAVFDGCLDADDAATVLRYMLWQGEDSDQVATAIGALSGPAAADRDNQSIAEVEFIRQWFYGVPGVRRPGGPDGSDGTAADHGDGGPAANGGAGLAGLSPKLAQLISGASDEVVASVVQSLQGLQLDRMKPELVAMSLLAIAHTDRGGTAAEVCETLLAYAARRKATTWHALLTAVRAEIALLQGDLETADAKSAEALDMMHTRGWGVLIGLPLGTAVFANTALGRHDRAAELLERELPDAVFRTVFGVQYLRARGHHYLATDRAFAGLSDFETCGRLLRDANAELHKGIPWRADLAEANLRIGRTKTAREWAEAQVEVGGSRPSSRARGVALRLLAQMSRPNVRTSLLHEAIDLLRASGDRRELAVAFSDLSATHYELGDYARARLVARHASQVAATGPVEAAVGSRLVALEHLGLPEEPGAAMLLTDAECRVAGLAALGYSNREISRRIHVTMSTVEQHLTRVYRKLKVASRADLPSKMLEHRIPTLSDHFAAGETAAPAV
ncbi:AAA family ATPase [Streptomyces sp. NPDC058595]|uniref:AAA family ATPase n=1 Tax=Streptomyces sp. NPDC058595 TaxID=3346550 RepID=UPI0036642A3E